MHCNKKRPAWTYRHAEPMRHEPLLWKQGIGWALVFTSEKPKILPMRFFEQAKFGLKEYKISEDNSWRKYILINGELGPYDILTLRQNNVSQQLKEGQVILKELLKNNLLLCLYK